MNALDIQRVLLVDDDADIRAIGQMSISTVAGWTCDLAGSGAEALTMLDPPPDIVLMDVMMPLMDGPELLRRMRAMGVMSPVIFLTAKVYAGDTEYLALGAAGVIAKPFNPIGLADEVKRIVTRASLPPVPRAGSSDTHVAEGS